jgi:ribonuclease BN (tRNA processing enzyme)
LESIREEGDRRHAEYMQGSDVVIHEAQYTPDEYPSKRHWGHSTYSYVVELAAAAGVRRLFLTHHDPSHDDEFVAAIEEKARELAERLGSPLEVCCAYEGCEITV